MTRRVCSVFKLGGILCALIGLLLGIGRSTFALNSAEIEWVVIQGTACVDANRDAVCEPDEAGVPGVAVRSDSTLLMTTNATGRFSVRVPAQSVIEFVLPAGYTSTTGELSTQVFESGRINVPLVPLTQQAVITATVAAPTATRIQPTATARATALVAPTANPTRQSTSTAKPTVTPEPSATLAPPTPAIIPPTEAPSTETPVPTIAATATTQAFATATTTATQAAAMVLNSKPTALPTIQRKAAATPITPLPSFEEEAQPAPRFSIGAMPRMVLVSGGLLLGAALLVGLFLYRSNMLKANGLAGAPTAAGYRASSQVMVWEQGSSPQAQTALTVAQLPSGKEWHLIAQRLLSQAHLKSISINAEAGILAASTVPAPVFVLSGVDGKRLVFTIDPSLPVRSGLVADRSQVSRIAKFTGAGRGEAHVLWRHVAQTRNLANAACPSWADWYLIVCQPTEQASTSIEK